MDALLGLLFAAVITSGTHTLGHIEEGQRQSVEVTVNPREFTESWDTTDKNKDLRIHGGGFRAQDALTNLTDAKKIGSAVRLANGIYKLGYLSKIPEKIWVADGTEGDTISIDKITGNKIATYSVVLSALSDLYRAGNPDTHHGLEFWQSKKGAPGINFKITW